jgi:hypothetical protein
MAHEPNNEPTPPASGGYLTPDEVAQMGWVDRSYYLFGRDLELFKLNADRGAGDKTATMTVHYSVDDNTERQPESET